MSDTYQYLPPAGSLSGVAPINNHTLLGGAGGYAIHATGLVFIASAADTVSFEPTSNFNLTIQPEGGYVTMDGSWNLAIGNSGTFAVTDDSPGTGHNMIVAGAGVSTLYVAAEPTDNIFLQGVTQSDIDTAFAHAHEANGHNEMVSIPRAGGSALTVYMPNLHTTPPTAAQFHPI